MAKSIFQDMVKINSSKRQPRPLERKPMVEKVQIEEREIMPPREVREFREPRNVGAPKNRHGLWIVAVVAIVFFLFSLSYFFARADVTIVPKVKDFSIDFNLSAELDGVASSLPFDLVAISGEATKTVTATEEKEVTKSARGTVVLYNNFSSSVQRLDIDTRLEGSNGKIYKTEKAVVIPGMVGTKVGSIEVTVYGAEAGEAYNSKPLDFKILGFKGTPKYEKFYGRSKGDLSGGFKGMLRVASEEDKNKAIAELKVNLQNKLLQKATDQIPVGFILLKDAVSLDIEGEDDAGVLSSSDTLSLKLKGTLHGVLFEEKKLTTKIIEKVISDYDGTDVYIANIKDMKFNFVESIVSLKDLQKIDFNLKGTAKVVWKLNSSKLTSELVGQSKSDFNEILLKYPNVVSAHLSLSPIWNRTIPDKVEDIEIIVNYPIDQVDVAE